MSVDEYGKVYLIGAGPGNPNYLTKKAERLIREADVILYDRLVNPLILQYSKSTTEIIDVGKKPYAKHIQQEKINECIVEAARRYNKVVRLKGGDPAIFGRVQEEVDTLNKFNIAFEIVPGVTSASAAVATMQTGLTMRAVAKSVTFSTGHFKDSEENEVGVNVLVNGGTLAIYMGVKRLGKIIAQIQQYTDIDYPIAIVFQASCFNEFVVKGRLSNIVEKLERYVTEAKPGICIIGEVVGYTENVSTTSNPTQQFYVVSGTKHDALILCEHLYDAGYGCILNPNDTSNGTYHPSQYSYYDTFINQQENVTYISTECADTNTVLCH
ncbi:uroporphyrinogen-III C-methyltransferase [Staphylococcus roterodami]|nr:uroporphyrinogen-III C-methyltransferase [Staphylococcus roterodami]